MTGQADPSDNRWLEQAEITSARINRLAEALGARSYLEIGVETGVTFERVRVADLEVGPCS